MTSKKILITTPDYPPKLGGLATFSNNLVLLLEEAGYSVSVFCWEGVAQANQSYKNNKDYDLYFHIHYLGGFLGGYPENQSINFCHGSELFFTSPNFLKAWVKKMTKSKTLQYFEKCGQNIFISDFTREILKKNGLKVNHGRDLIFHNCIPLPSKAPIAKSIDSADSLKLCSIARDVPHKNLNGVFKLAEYLAKVSNKRVELSMTASRFKTSGNIIYHDISNINDSDLAKVYQSSDYNILLSEDHSAKGFVEGFGLTTLEAAKYATPSLVSINGGLKENIHHDFNGYQFEEISEETVAVFYKSSLKNYSKWSKNSYDHLKSSHSMEVFHRLLKRIIGGLS